MEAKQRHRVMLNFTDQDKQLYEAYSDRYGYTAVTHFLKACIESGLPVVLRKCEDKVLALNTQMRLAQHAQGAGVTDRVIPKQQAQPNKSQPKRRKKRRK